MNFGPTGSELFFVNRGTFWALPVVTSEGNKFVATGNKIFFHTGVPFDLSHWLLV